MVAASTAAWMAPSGIGSDVNLATERRMGRPEARDMVIHAEERVGSAAAMQTRRRLKVFMVDVNVVSVERGLCIDGGNA